LGYTTTAPEEEWIEVPPIQLPDKSPAPAIPEPDQVPVPA